jgi:hypothetical protein
MTRLSVAKRTGKFGQEQKAEEGFESESTNGMGATRYTTMVLAAKAGELCSAPRQRDAFFREKGASF